ncbi:MAG TPA: VOC family protein [Candidatus Bathyarchaeia archaeon]|nr:VOC family protein [Candidatus Bathyarchaeia archaeon]
MQSVTTKVKPVPTGYHSVTPSLIVEGVPRLLEFVKQAFNAEEKERFTTPDGRIAHAEVKIGDSIIMMGEASEQYKAMPSWLYLYLDDVDATYKRALQAGATSVNEPKNQFYGDRSAAVKDSSGNIWGIATHVEDVSREELERRMKEQPKQ